MRVSVAVTLSLALIACGGGNGKGSDAGQKPQCSDGIDNDGDGLVDYPNDPGCFSPNEDSEVDDCPDGPGCPECGNGKDDDGNGLTDYSGGDPGCTSAGDPDEYTVDPLACGPSTMIQSLGFHNESMGMFMAGVSSSLSGKCGGGGDADIYLIHLHMPQVMVATTDTDGTSADTVLYVRSANCQDTNGELACNDDISSADNKSSITVALEAGTYFLIVQAKDSSQSGTFDVQVTFQPGEGTPCTTGGTECGAGLVCRVPLGGSSMVCSKPMCSDGVDDDMDGKKDYPDDPGCDSPSDNDETDDCPNGPNCPECGNGIDDNMNGKTDYPMEPNCIAASTSSEWCTSHENVAKIIAPLTMGDTTTATSDFDPACAGTMGLPDLTYRLDVPALTSLSISATTGGSWFPVLELLDHTCGGTAVACSSDSISQGALAAGTYFVVVDGDFTGDKGPFTLSVSGVIATGQSCESALAQAGAFVCESGSLCKGMAGSRTCQKAQCSDGLNNDGVNGTDYPNDPGCDSPDDDDESHTGPMPQCFDTLDNDGDTHKDYAQDLSCWAASGNSEAFCNPETDRTQLIYAGSQTGTTASAHGDYSPSCVGSTGNDITFALVLPVAVDSLTVDTIGSAIDTVLAVTTTTCLPANELGCNDDGGGNLTSSLTLTSLAAGTYAVVVDSYSTAGAFNLNTHGVVAANTACTSPLFSTGVLSCPAGTTCNGGTCH